MKELSLFMGIVVILSCGGSSTSPTPCEIEQTATAVVRNELGEDVRVLIDGSREGFLLPGEQRSFTITAVTMHTIRMETLGFFSSFCDWRVSLPVCGSRTFTCMD